MNCPHEDDITYGKSMTIGKYQILQMVCEACGALGTQLEEQDQNEPEHFEPLNEIWHEATDYYNDTIAKNYKAGLYFNQ